MRVHRPLHRGRAVPLGSADLRRKEFREELREKFDLLCYSTLISLDLSFDLWSFHTVAESALGTSFRKAVPHISEFCGSVDFCKL